MEGIYTIEEAAEILEVSEKTVYRWIKQHPDWFYYSPKAINYVHFFMKSDVVSTFLKKRAEINEFTYKIYDYAAKKYDVKLTEIDKYIISDIEEFYGFARQKARKFFKNVFFTEKLAEEFDFIKFLKNKYLKESD